MIPIDADHDQREAYLAHFAPWENEQLACIHDYLLEIIAPGLSFILPPPSYLPLSH